MGFHGFLSLQYVRHCPPQHPRGRWGHREGLSERRAVRAGQLPAAAAIFGWGPDRATYAQPGESLTFRLVASLVVLDCPWSWYRCAWTQHWYRLRRGSAV